MEQPKCEICGEPMPAGEEMFKFHGYSGNCPKPPLPKSVKPTYEQLESDNAKLREENARLKVVQEPVAYWDGSYKRLSWGNSDPNCAVALYPSPPAFLIAEAEARGRKEALLEAADVFDKQSNRELFCGTVADEIRNMANNP